MEHDNQLIDQAASLMELLVSGPPDDTTAAQLHNWIERATGRLKEAETQSKELQLLRSDIIARISGMAKAVAVARNSESQLADAADLVNSLEQSNAVELITTCRKVSARFRDTFRSSFALTGLHTSGKRSHQRDYSDFR